MKQRHVIIPVFIPHRGCTYRCIYCNQVKITGVSQVIDPKKIEELVYRYLRYNPEGPKPEIAFYGGSFTALDEKEMISYLKAVYPLVDKGVVEGIRVSTRPDAISPGILKVLKGLGVNKVELGVQSLDREVLLAAGRPYDPQVVYRSSLQVKEAGLKLGHQIMIGLPLSNREKEMETTRKVIEMKPDMVRLYPTLVFRGTKLEEMYRKGEYLPWSLNQALKTCALMLIRLEKAGIKVIRTGLQPSEEVSLKGEVIDGPFHPAFGEMVESTIFRWQAYCALSKFLKGGRAREVELFVNRRDLSKMIGQKRCNVFWLEELLGFQKCKVIGVDGEDKDWVGIAESKKGYPELVMSRDEFYAMWDEHAGFVINMP